MGETKISDLPDVVSFFTLLHFAMNESKSPNFFCKIQCRLGLFGSILSSWVSHVVIHFDFKQLHPFAISYKAFGRWCFLKYFNNGILCSLTFGLLPIFAKSSASKLQANPTKWCTALLHIFSHFTHIGRTISYEALQVTILIHFGFFTVCAVLLTCR